MSRVPPEDAGLLRILADAHAEAGRRAGAWLVCRPGCSQCCLGPVEINALDAARLENGFERLTASDPARAARLRVRAIAHGSRPEEETDDEPCPALDPESRMCDLYESRPVLCRVFGPASPVGDGAIGHCELCYEGASEADLAACAVEFDPDNVEDRIASALPGGPTTVARVLYVAASR